MIDTEQAVSSRRAAQLAGISYRQLDYWARLGVITPSLAQATGSGSRRLYSMRDVRLLRVLREICAVGPLVGEQRELVAELAALDPFEGLLYITTGGRVGRDRAAVMRGAPAAVVIDLGAIAEAVALEAAVIEEGDRG